MVLRRFLWFVAFVAMYEWFAVTGTRDEALAACGIAAVATLTGAYVARTAARLGPIDVRGYVALVTRIPFAACRETIDVLGPVLWRAFVRGERAPGRWIALRYEADANGSAGDGSARRTFVVFGSGLTPNACPLDIDDSAGRLYLHQLVHRRESAAGDPVFPI